MNITQYLSIIFCIFQYNTFGPKGHYIVARIAEKYLEKHNPKALEKLNTILNSITTFQKSQHHPFVEAASYPDDIKGINWKIFNKWHYDNQPYIPTAARKKVNKKDLESTKENLVWAINELKGALRNTTHSKVNDFLAKAFSLSQLIHFVGDIHQPLHTINRIDPKTLKFDKGGNDFKIIYVGSGGNLHSFWDKCLKMFPEINRLEAPITKEYWQKLDVVTSELMTEFPEKKFKQELQETSIRAWQKENYKIAVKFAYANLVPGQQIQDNYLDKARPQLKRLMVLGGYRLGKMLDDIYKDDQQVFELHLKISTESYQSDQDDTEDQSDEEESVMRNQTNEKPQKKNNKRDHTYEPSIQISVEDDEFDIVLRKNRKNGMILNNNNDTIIKTIILLLIFFQLIQ